MPANVPLKSKTQVKKKTPWWFWAITAVAIVAGLPIAAGFILMIYITTSCSLSGSSKCM